MFLSHVEKKSGGREKSEVGNSRGEEGVGYRGKYPELEAGSLVD